MRKIECVLTAATRYGTLQAPAGGFPRFGVGESNEVAKGTKATILSAPLFAVDGREQTIQIVKVRLQISPLFLKDVWIPVSRLELV